MKLSQNFLYIFDIIAALVSKDNNQSACQFLNYNSTLKTLLVKIILPCDIIFMLLILVDHQLISI